MLLEESPEDIFCGKSRALAPAAKRHSSLPRCHARNPEKEATAHKLGRLPVPFRSMQNLKSDTAFFPKLDRSSDSDASTHIETSAGPTA